MKLHTYFRSSCSYRVRIALEYKGLPREDVFVHLRRGEQRLDEHLARNPQGLVPILEDGPVVLGQSLAILEYLEERHPEPPLLPPDPAGRARVRQIALAIACDIQPLQNLGVTRALEHDYGLSADDVTRWCRAMIETGLGAVERLLDDPRTGAFAHGQTPTIADLCLVPQVFNARRFGCDLAPLPTVERIEAHCRDVPAFQRAAPETQPDADA